MISYKPQDLQDFQTVWEQTHQEFCLVSLQFSPAFLECLSSHLWDEALHLMLLEWFSSPSSSLRASKVSLYSLLLHLCRLVQSRCYQPLAQSMYSLIKNSSELGTEAMYEEWSQLTPLFLKKYLFYLRKILLTLLK